MKRFPGFQMLNPLMAGIRPRYHKRIFNQDPSCWIAEYIVD
jgi:hypothetical protein